MLSLSLSGRYAAMGRQAAAALRLFVADSNAAGGIEAAGERYEVTLECIDDQSDPSRVAGIYRDFVARKQPQVILGPYSSALTRAAAAITEPAGVLMVNHGGADDRLNHPASRTTVSVLTPAGEYMSGVVTLISTLKFWRKRLAIVSSGTPFSQLVAQGAEAACHDKWPRRRGVRVRLKFAGRFDPERTPDVLGRALRRNRINAVLCAGSYEFDVAMMRVVSAPEMNVPVLGCVAAGVNRFREDLGDDAEGIVGPAQWDETAEIPVEIGPPVEEFTRRMRAHFGVDAVDYPAAQAYAAALVTAVAIRAADSVDGDRVRAAFSDLRTTTFFGKFAIDRTTGRQTGHKMLLVQWHAGRKHIIEPEPSLGAGALEFPSGWRVLLGSLEWFWLSRRDEDDADEIDEDSR